MAIGIFKRNDPLASLGASFGTGISSGLQQLAQNKMDALVQKKQQQSTLAGLQSLGFDDQEAAQIAGLDPMIQREIVKQKLLEPSQQAYAQAINQILGIQDPSSLYQQSQGIQEETITAEEKLSPTGQVVEKKIQEKPSLIKPGLNQQQVTELAKLALKKEKASKDEIAERFKATQPYREKILEGARSARQDLKDLDRLEELQTEGKLDTPGYSEFLKRAGFDIASLRNPASEEFQKIEANFLRNAKQYFGGRISNYEVEQFLKTIPNLSMSNEGRKRVIANLKYVTRAALEYNNALKEVIAENRGIPPFDLSEKIDDKIEKKLDKLSEKFREDLKKPVPKEQNKLVTALQAGAGSVIGLPGKLLGGIGNALGKLSSAA